MTEDRMIKYSAPVLRRLPMYHHFLEILRDAGHRTISSTVIADHFNLDNIIVRKDLAQTGSVGKPKVGFEIGDLIRTIEEYLGWNKLNQSILVGCGHLGTALLGYEGFSRNGFRIVAAFDSDPALVGTEVRGKEVLPLEKLVNLCRRMHIEIGILTVPSSEAQRVAEMMVSGGIKGIWNFAPCGLNVPKGVAVLEQGLAGSLAVLVRQVEEIKNR